VKLLLDENLSPRLVAGLQSAFPGSTHVHDLGLGSADDDVIWKHAAEHDFAIVSKDSDFHQRSFVYGSPPKVIWIRLGNCSTVEIADLLARRTAAIRAFESDMEAAFLIIE
jgi:predicted nuclease of predicted toxin-antitoxin system